MSKSLRPGPFAWLLPAFAIALALAAWLVPAVALAEIRVQLGGDADHQPDQICIRKVWSGPVAGTEAKKWGQLDEFSRADVCRANIPSPPSALNGTAPEKVDFVCAKNRRPTSHDQPRTLVVEVDQVTDLARMDLTGSLITLYTSARSGRIVVLSGDYEGDSEFVALDLGFIPLTPTCREILVDIPDGAGRVGFDRIPEGEMLAQCASADCGERGGVHRVLVNTGPRTATIAPGGGTTIPDPRRRHKLHAWGENVDLRGEWSGNPDEVVVMLATQVEFSWQGGCLYTPCRAVASVEGDRGWPQDPCRTACPMVSIPSAGIDEGERLTNPGTGAGERQDSCRLELMRQPSPRRGAVAA